MRPQVQQCLRRASALALREDRSCAVCEEGTAVCWSYDESVELPLPRAAVDVAVGLERACVLDEAGAVHCLGDLTHGRLLTEAGPGTVKQLLHGFASPCGVTSDQTARCWGGRKTVLSGVHVDRAFGSDDFGCRIHQGELHCWIGTRDDVREVSPRLEDVVAVDGYRDQGESGCDIWDEISVCAVTAQGHVFCSRNDGFEFKAVPGIEGATEVAVGDGFACALRENESVACWGPKARMQGSNSGADSAVNLRAFVDAQWIESDGTSVCAGTRSGDVVCWGPRGGWHLPVTPQRRSSPVP